MQILEQRIEQTQNILDPYDRLQRILEMSDEKTVKELQEKFGIDHEFCIGGIVCAMDSCQKADFRPFQWHPSWLLHMKLGFTEEQADQKHKCLEAKCNYVADLGTLLNHMIGYHKIALPILAKTIPVLKNDSRPIPKGINGFVNRIANMHKSAD